MSGSELQPASGDQPRGSSQATVLIGDEANQVSVQVLQSIYNEITGKTETVGKNYRDAFEIAINHIEQLNFKIKQAHEQYNICADNCAVTIYYLNNR